MKLLTIFLLSTLLSLSGNHKSFSSKYFESEIPIGWEVISNTYNVEVGYENIIIREKYLESDELNSINIIGFKDENNGVIQKEDAFTLFKSIKDYDTSTDLYKDYIVSYPQALTKFGGYYAYEFIFSYKYYRENIGYISCSGAVMIFKNNYTVISLMDTYSNNKMLDHFKALNFIESNLKIK